jgi:hypothetical protein
MLGLNKHTATPNTGQFDKHSELLLFYWFYCPSLALALVAMVVDLHETALDQPGDPALGAALRDACLAGDLFVTEEVGQLTG